MSNRATLQFTRFANLNLKGEQISKKEDYGYRLYDEYESVYNNTFESFEELQEAINLHTVGEYLKNNHRDFYVDAVLQREGLNFNGRWYSLKELGIKEEEE
jgi:hypothetical protein